MRGVFGEQKTECERCGFEHLLSQLTKQKGLLLCTCHGCLDNMDVERRDQMIGRILAEEGEFKDEKVDVLSQPGELPTF